MGDDVQGSDLSAFDVARQAELLELTQDAILVRDLSNSAITYWNRGAEQLYGWSREAARGQLTHTLLKTVFPVSLDALNEALVTNGYWEGELIHTRQDGSQVVVASRQAVQRDTDGLPLAILEINTDITERKRAEAEQVRLAAEQRARQLAERSLERLTTLQRVTAALSEALTPAEVGAVVMGQGIRALDATSGRISLLRADGETVDVVSSTGYTSIRSPIRLDEPLPTNKVIRTGQAMFAPTFAEVLEQFPRIGQAVAPLIPGALASVPLIVQGRVIGAMTLVFNGDRTFDASDRELLTALVTQAAQALERSRLYELSLLVQEDLRRSRDQLAAILGGIAEGVTVQDGSGGLVFANDIAARMSGFESAVQFTEAFPNVVQRYALFDEHGQPFSYDDLPGRRLLRGEQPDEVVIQFRDLRGGESRWSILDATPVRDADGTIQLVVNIFRDITERKRQTDATAFLAEASTALGSTIDIEMRLQHVAELAVPRLADWCSIDLFDGADDHVERVAIAHVDATDEAEAEADAAQPRSSLTVELRARGQTFGSMTFLTTVSNRVYSLSDQALAEDLGVRVSLAIDAARLFEEAQEQANHQATLNAALRETVEERDRALSDLRQALRTRDEFLASASHDLKNPLASIKATAQLLERRLGRPGEVDVDRFREGLQRLDAIATRAAGLVEELLDQARMQMGRPLDLDRQLADLVRITHEVAQEQQQSTERHTIQVESSLSELIGLWDARRLGRVLSNLLDNAVKYSPEGGPVTVRVRRDGDAAIVEVSDSGIGIPQNDQRRIFERFQRASNVERRIGGTGIGLASARHILDGHGATIEVISREGSGATFSIRLPIGLETSDTPSPLDA
ncbi:MAG TPA: ATP-binding protein [Chloroflexota bacterium]|nr:ATP-binding protein [Chloroflexota bacterium]